MATDIVGSWERVSFYYARESEWGTEKETDFFKIRESSTSWPYSAKPIIAPAGGMGSGLPYDDHGNFQQGRDGLAFPSRHPMTRIALRDLLALFFQGAEYGTAGGACYLNPLSAADAVVWKAQEDLFATVVCINDGGAGATSQMRGSSCLLSGIDITLPMNTPSETGGQGEIGCSWIGEKGARDTTYTIGTPTVDAGAVLLTSGWDFKIGAVVYDYLNASISLTNLAVLDPSGGTEHAMGATIGKLGCTGSVTMLFDEEAGTPGGGCGQLISAHVSNTQQILHFIYLSTVDPFPTWFDIEIPVVINALPGEPTDLGGVASLTFPFQLAGDADSPIKVTIHELDSSTFSDIVA